MSRSLKMELRCCSMGVFFYLKPRSDSITFINITQHEVTLNVYNLYNL